MPFGANHFFVHCKDYDIAKRVSIEKKLHHLIINSQVAFLPNERK
jgi:hypothetical protein